MKTMNSLTSKMLISMFVTATFSFFSCSDDTLSNDEPHHAVPENAETALLEPYGLTFENFITPNDVQILNADTTEIAVSKALADKMEITSFINHPLGIWHDKSQLPYARKATAERLVGDTYILTVKPATVAEIVGNKQVNLNTSLYVNPNANASGLTRSGGIDMPSYAAKYVDAEDVIHPAVIHMTNPFGYDKGYYTEDDVLQAPVATRGGENGYQYVTAEQMLERQTRAEAHINILSLHQEIKMNKKFQCGEDEKDSINVDFKAPLDFDLNYMIRLDGGVKWHVILPEPYVERFQTGIDGEFAFKPELTVGFKKEWKLDKEKWRKTLCKFNSYTFTFWVGCVPVCIVCEPQMFMKIDGKVTGEARIGLKYDYQTQFYAYVNYTDDNGWETIKGFKEVKNDLSFIRPQAKVSAEAGIGLYIGMDVKIYDVAGPEVAIGPRLGASAEVTVSPFEKNFDEIVNVKSKVDLSVNAVVGAKLELLGYDLASYNMTLKLAGPWTLWKYPSDGSEHKAGDTEEMTLYNTYEATWMKENPIYAAKQKYVIEKLMEMRGATYDQAHMIVRDMCMEALNKIYGHVVDNVRIPIDCLTEYILGDLQKEYDAYEYQKHAEAGDTEWCKAKNWENICIELNRSYDCHAQAYIFDKVHQDFVKTFGREPNMTQEDLTWLADHIVNYDKYTKEKYERELADLNAIKANIRSRYSSYQTDYPTLFEKALKNLDYQYRDKYNCAPTPSDDRVYQLFETMMNELIAKQKESEAQKEATDWNNVSQILRTELSAYFDYNLKYSSRMLKSTRSWFQGTYNREPSTNQGDIQIMVAHFKELMKKNYNIEC